MKYYKVRLSPKRLHKTNTYIFRKNFLLHYYVLVEKYKLPDFTFLSPTYPIANVRQGKMR